MRVAVQPRDVESSGIIESWAFTVQAGAHIMAVLSGLYKNPVEAIVREYLTNMYDAYIALKRVRPNDKAPQAILHLPSALAPYIEFKDFGIGMSFNTVREVYSQYGNSTKNDSNLEVGGFGLGSKTAFCYNNGQPWTIESRFEGTKNVFLASVSAKGIPSLNHVQQEPTTEHSGVTIRVPIERDDFQTVYAAAAQYVTYFPMPLKVLNAPSGSDMKPVTYILRKGEWGVREKKETYGHPRVIMGNVPYDAQEVVRRALSGQDYNDTSFIVNNPFDFYIPIGAVDIVPSRDALKETPHTLKTVREAVAKMQKELEAAVSDHIANAANEWAALDAVKALRRSVYHINEHAKTFTYKGKALDLEKGIERKLSDLVALDNAARGFTYGRNAETQGAVIALLDTRDMLRVTPGCGQYNNDKPTRIVINDHRRAEKIVRAVAAEAIIEKTSGGRRRRRYGHHPGHALLLNTMLTPKELSDFFGGIPVDFISTASSLIDTIKIPVRERSDSPINVYRYNDRSWDARVRIPDTDAHYYLVLEKNGYTGRYEHTSISELKPLAVMLKLPSIGEGVVYGFRAEDVGNAPANWIELKKAVDDACLAYVKANVAELQKGYSVGIRGYQNEIFVEAIRSLGRKDGDFGLIVELMALNEKWDDDDTLRSVFPYFGSSQSWLDLVEKPAKKLDTMGDVEKRLTDKYPLLPVLVHGTDVTYLHSGNSRSFGKHRQAVLDYLTLCD